MTVLFDPPSSESRQDAKRDVTPADLSDPALNRQYPALANCPLIPSCLRPRPAPAA